MPLLFFMIKKLNDTITEQSLIESLDKYGLNLLTFEKPDENPHYHAVLDTAVKPDTMRNWFKRTYDIEDITGSCSVKKVRTNLQRASIYILKDKTVIQNTLLSDEDLNTFLTQTEDINIDKAKRLAKRKHDFKHILLEDYIPLPDLYEQPNTYGYSTNNEQIIYEHLDLHITMKCHKETQYLHIRSLEQFRQLLINAYYPLLMKKLMKEFSEVLEKRRQNLIHFARDIEL